MINNKTILVTGASSGIGLSIVELLAHSKAKVILTARNELKLQKVISSIQGQENRYIIADLEDNNQLDTLVNKLPQLDGIVFCAGVNEFIPAKFINEEKAQKIFNINYFSSVFLLQNNRYLFLLR